MKDVDREGFFIFLTNVKKWKYSEEEQLMIWEKLPDRISYEQLKQAVIMNTGKARITGQKMVNLGWDIVKKGKAQKRVNRKQYEGCNNCEYGYIKFPKISMHKKAKYTYNLINIAQLGMYPTAKVLCPCTEKNYYFDAFKLLANLYFEDKKLYEICYLTLYYFCAYYLNPKRFSDFNEFNPYRMYGYVEYDDCHILKQEDLQYFPHLIDQGIKPVKKKTMMPESTLKSINGENTYNAKIYD